MTDQWTEFRDAVQAWQAQTFPGSTTESVLKHLKDKHDELQASHAPEEAADVLLLLIAFSAKENFDLLRVAQEKFAPEGMLTILFD